MRFTHDELFRLEGVMRSASIGLRQVGVNKEVAGDLRTLEYIMSVIRSAGDADFSNPEEKADALECIFDGLFR